MLWLQASPCMLLIQVEMVTLLLEEGGGGVPALTTWVFMEIVFQQ